MDFFLNKFGAIANFEIYNRKSKPATIKPQKWHSNFLINLLPILAQFHDTAYQVKLLNDCLQLAHCLPNKITHLCSSGNKWVCFSFSNSNRLAGSSRGRCLVHFLNYIPLICWPLQSSAHNTCGCILKNSCTLLGTENPAKPESK